jgi:hypothetical protein
VYAGDAIWAESEIVACRESPSDLERRNNRDGPGSGDVFPGTGAAWGVAGGR